MGNTALAEREGSPAAHVVVPVPVIEWETVLKADNPLREPTRGRLRELRKKQRVSDGVTVYRRGERGMEGRSTYYSVLTALAAKSRQQGYADEATRLEQGASELEAQFAARLGTYLSQHPLPQLPQADFFYELTTETALRLEDWEHLADAVLAAARVDEMAGEIAHLEGFSPRGEPVSVDLPRALLERQSLETGDLAWVFYRVIGDAAVVELLPAIRVRLPLPPGRLSAFTDVDTPEDELRDPSDGLTDEERTAVAERYMATVGARLSQPDIARLRADVATGRIPVRRFRPAG